MKANKTTLVKDIFFEATNGKRNANNYVDGMWLIETIAANNYKWAIEKWWEELVEGKRDAKSILDSMVDSTYSNTSGVNGYTKRSMSVLNTYYKFFA